MARAAAVHSTHRPVPCARASSGLVANLAAPGRTSRRAPLPGRESSAGCTRRPRPPRYTWSNSRSSPHSGPSVGSRYMEGTGRSPSCAQTAG
eukprot:6873433-Prymnesium_polylepis.1